MSIRDDRLDPSIAKQVAKQHQATEEFMREPFEPLGAASALSAPAVTVLDPVAAAGKKVFESESCDACHGEGGTGGAAMKLTGQVAQMPAEEITKLLKQPNAQMSEGGMQPIQVSDEELKALVAYIKSLK
jgi:mono/diheme cytochrome c family protein